MKKAIYAIYLLMGMFVLSGCGSKEQEWAAFLNESVLKSGRSLDQLRKHITSGLINNTTLLTEYAEVVREDRPELSEIIDALAEDAGTNGPLFRGLQSRFDDAKIAVEFAPKQGEQVVESVWSELELISGAANPSIYGMMLTDPINVLADMSNGRLPRVEAMSKQAAMQANKSADMGAGSQLIGNPSYGQWQTNSSGSTFWEWYGKYALFSALFRSPVYYDRWSYGRNYSYYHDYGRNSYTSPNQFRSQATVDKQAKAKFQTSGKSFQSPYARSRTGASSTAAKPKPRPSSSSFKSSYQNSSSARNASSRSSRSYSRGK